MKTDETNRQRLDRICGEIMAALERPQCAEVKVSEEAVRKRAEQMAREGYYPSPQTVVALGYYLKGYGLWLSGGVGTGKTEFFRHLRPLAVPTRATGYPPQIVLFPLVQTVEMSVDDIRDWLNENRNAEVVLDDVGAEPVFNHFGGKFEILPYILDKRMESPCRTHATSNLSAKAMGERYHNVRILDRFAEMFVKVEFSGHSLRRSKPNAAIRKAQAEFTRRTAEAATGAAAENPATAREVAANGVECVKSERRDAQVRSGGGGLIDSLTLTPEGVEADSRAV